MRIVIIILVALAIIILLSGCEEHPERIHPSRTGDVCMIWTGTFALPMDCKAGEAPEEYGPPCPDHICKDAKQ